MRPRLLLLSLFCLAIGGLLQTFIATIWIRGTVVDDSPLSGIFFWSFGFMLFHRPILKALSGNEPVTTGWLNLKSAQGRILRVWRALSIVLALGLFFGGMFGAGADAPIHKEGNLYLGKSKRHYSRTQYEIFQRWQLSLFVSWSAFIWIGLGSELPLNPRFWEQQTRKKPIE